MNKKYCTFNKSCGYKIILNHRSAIICEYDEYCDYQVPKDSRVIMKSGNGFNKDGTAIAS